MIFKFFEVFEKIKNLFLLKKFIFLFTYLWMALLC